MGIDPVLVSENKSAVPIQRGENSSFHVQGKVFYLKKVLRASSIFGFFRSPLRISFLAFAISIIPSNSKMSLAEKRFSPIYLWSVKGRATDNSFQSVSMRKETFVREKLFTHTEQQQKKKTNRKCGITNRCHCSSSLSLFAMLHLFVMLCVAEQGQRYTCVLYEQNTISLVVHDPGERERSKHYGAFCKTATV